MAASTRNVVTKPLTNIPALLSLVWLDTNDKEYFKFMDSYSKMLGTNQRSWSYCNNKEMFLNILKSVKLPQKIILISSGSLTTEIIKDIHDLEQLQSVYIFCQMIPRYAPLADLYRKIIGIHSDSNLLYQQLRENPEALQSEEAGKL
jgi:hypothetical protein